MTNSNGDKSRNERFLDALVEELRTMSDSDLLQGESAEELVKLGERILGRAREDSGNLRMDRAKRKLSVVAKALPASSPVSVAEAKKYLEMHTRLTLAARGLNELSDADLLDIFLQAKYLEDASDDSEGSKE
jgi:hypothetical protein